MWNLGLTIIIMKGSVEKTKLHACYKKSHIILDLIWKFKVSVFIFGGAERKVAGINYDNPIMESCHE